MLTTRFLEGMSVALFILVVFACFMFGLYIGREVHKQGFNRTRLQASISIFVVLSGEAVILGWIWYSLENAGTDIGWMSRNPILMLGMVTHMLGVICVIRVFAPDTWGRSVWFITSLIAVGFATAFMYL